MCPSESSNQKVSSLHQVRSRFGRKHKFRGPLGPKFLKSIGPRPPGYPSQPNATMGKMRGGGFSSDFLQGSPQKTLRNRVPAESSAKISGLKSNFTTMVSFGWVAWGPQLSTFIGKTTQPPKPKETNCETWGFSTQSSPQEPYRPLSVAPSHTPGVTERYRWPLSHLRGVTEFDRWPLSHLRGVTERHRWPLSHLRGVTEYDRRPLSHLRGVTGGLATQNLGAESVERAWGIPTLSQHWGTPPSVERACFEVTFEC